MKPKQKKQPNQKKTAPVVSDPPVNVAIPNTTEVKMQAILALSKAVQALAETLDSVNTNISIIGNTITASAKGGSGIGVSMKPNP